MDIPTKDVVEWLNKYKTEGGDHMKCLKDLVSKFKGKSVSLKNPVRAKWVILDLHDTIYENSEDVVNGWGKFYLPDEVQMQVIGAVTGTSYPCEQLVLMTCKDGKIYVYDEEELHVVASSLEQLCAEGLQHPAPLSYYKGQAFEDLTDEDWSKVKQGEVGKRLDEEHETLVTAHKSGFLERLKNGASKATKSTKMLERETETEKWDSEKKKLKPMRPSSGKSSELDVEWSMELLKQEIQDYARKKSWLMSSSEGSLSDKIRQRFDELEKEIEDRIRQKYKPMSSQGDSSSEGTKQMRTKESEKYTEQSLRFRPSPLADVVATKRWADPSRARRVAQIMEDMEEQMLDDESFGSSSEFSYRHSSSVRVKSLMKRLKKEIEDDVWKRLGLESVRPTLGDSSHQTKAGIIPESDLSGAMNQLKMEIQHYVKYFKHLSSRSPSTDGIRESLDLLEEKIRDHLRQQYEPTSSTEGSSSEGTMQIWTKESEKDTEQSLRFRPSPLADVVATKRWADPSRAQRVAQIMEDMEKQMRRDQSSSEFPYRHSSSEVESLMKRLKEEIEDDVWKRLGLESVRPTLGDSSHQTKAGIIPESDLNWSMDQLKMEIQDYVKYMRMSPRSLSTDGIRESLDLLEEKIRDHLRQQYEPTSSTEGSSSGTMQMRTKESEKDTEQSLRVSYSPLADVVATKRWADPRRAQKVAQIMEDMEEQMRHEERFGSLSMSPYGHSSSEHSFESLMKRLKEEIEDDVQQKLALESVRPTLGVSSHQTKAVN